MLRHFHLPWESFVPPIFLIDKGHFQNVESYMAAYLAIHNIYVI